MSGRESRHCSTELGTFSPDRIAADVLGESVIRERQADGSGKLDYDLSDAPSETPLTEFNRVSKAAHQIEEWFECAKGETGLADYEVRTWRG
jgi:SRSO17 transposase